MQSQTTTCTHRESRWQRCWNILRAVLRGYLAGQPVNEERPRKVCC
ncbi:MAG: hypothetical protein HOP19_17610 [Acidobacteria bacterium]|nr:hypothetical protein [Acidobacteriota bacterium]